MDEKIQCYGCDKVWEEGERKYRIYTPVIMDIHLYCKTCYDLILDTSEQKENNSKEVAGIESGIYK